MTPRATPRGLGKRTALGMHQAALQPWSCTCARSRWEAVTGRTAEGKERAITEFIRHCCRWMAVARAAIGLVLPSELMPSLLKTVWMLGARRDGAVEGLQVRQGHPVGPPRLLRGLNSDVEVGR